MTTARLAGAPLLALLALGNARAPSALEPDAPIKCDSCDEWNAPRAPFKVFGNTYFVGPAGLSSLLVVSDLGLILLDGGLPQTAPLIDANIRALGFRTTDVKLILTSHAHFDHVGGVAALQRYTGATVAGSAPSARALALGHPTPDDPQYEAGASVQDFPAVARVRTVEDKETLRLGRVAITAHHTPGHTPGATSWTWQSCEGTRCLDMVYADSLTAISAPGFRFTGSAAPGRAWRRPSAAASRRWRSCRATCWCPRIRRRRGWTRSWSNAPPTPAAIRSWTRRRVGRTRPARCVAWSRG